MIVLGIESTAHTFGVGIVENGKILANQRDMYTTESGGIIPMESAKHHVAIKDFVYFNALDEAGIKKEDIDVIAFSQGPGLAPCLKIGMEFAKELSKKLSKPVVGINHCIAHLEIGKLTGAKDPVMLYVSGANTQIIAYAAGKYRVFGETLDLGVGNFIDTVARFMGEGFPGGPRIQELASRGKKYIELPYKVKGMDIALAGIQTNLKRLIENLHLKDCSQQVARIDGSHSTSSECSLKKSVKGEGLSHSGYQLNNDVKSFIINSKKSERQRANYTKEDIAYSLQETVFAMLVETAERALAHTGKNELLLGGGVACNSRLQEMCKKMCDERIEKTKMFVPPRSLLVDNAAMIAFLGEIMFKRKCNIYDYKNLKKLDFNPRQRTDDVNVGWK